MFALYDRVSRITFNTVTGYLHYLKIIFLVFSAAVLVAGCGGGGGGGGGGVSAEANPGGGGAGGNSYTPSFSEIVIDVKQNRQVVVNDINGDPVTILVNASQYQAQTVQYNSSMNKVSVDLLAVLDSTVLQDVHGNLVTLESNIIVEPSIVQDIGKLNNPTLAINPGQKTDIAYSTVTMTVIEMHESIALEEGMTPPANANIVIQTLLATVYAATVHHVNITGIVTIELDPNYSSAAANVYSLQEYLNLQNAQNAQNGAIPVFRPVTVTAVFDSTTVSFTLTAYESYVSMTTALVSLGLTLKIEEDRGITLGYDGGKLTFAVLPPPNSSDGVNYQTAEYNKQAGLSNIKADAAYQRGYFGQNVIVGVVDTGVMTSHVDLADNIVPGKRFTYFNSYNDVNDADGHGTHVAGIIGAAKNDQGIQGVAPSVSIMPLQFGSKFTGALSGNFKNAFIHGIQNNVKVLNNSWGSDEIVAGTFNGSTVVFRMPYASAFLAHDNGSANSYFLQEFDAINDIAAGEDVVLVWAAGNNGWNSETGSIRLCDAHSDFSSSSITSCSGDDVSNATTQELLDGFVSEEMRVTTTGSTYTQTAEYGAFSALSLSTNSSGDFAVTPLFNEELLGHYLAVVAVDQNNQIASFSNGCGDARDWCLAAPGVNITSTYNNGGYRKLSGTSMAAPHVSGGLAVLKSRFPHMPMEVVLAILLDTATDLGAAGVDDVYGHGLMNLDAAASVQGSVNLVVPGGAVGGMLNVADNGNINADRLPFASVSSSRNDVSPALFGLLRRLEGISVAVNYLDDQYYNMPVSGLLTPNSDDSLPMLGAAATDIMQQHDTVKTQAFGGLSFVQDAASGNFRQLTYDNPLLRVRYDVCADCDKPFWAQSMMSDSDNVAPYFADDKQSLFGAVALGDNAELFASAGLGDDAEHASYKQWGLRLHSGVADRDARARWMLEYSEIREDGGFLGNQLSGGMGIAGALTRQIRVGGDFTLAPNWNAFADYTYGRGEAEGSSASMLSAANYRYVGWSAGIAAHSLMLHRDRMHLSMIRETALSDARALILRGVAGSDGVNYARDAVRWSDNAATIVQWGYGAQLTPMMHLGVGAEYAWRNGERARGASVEMRWRY